MQDVPAVAEAQALQQLVHEGLAGRGGGISRQARPALPSGPEAAQEGPWPGCSPACPLTFTISGSKSPLQLSKYFFRSWQ